MATTTSTQTTCNHCQTPTSLHCAGCKEAPILNDGLQPAYFCSKQCQVAAWPAHKAVCKRLKLRKVVYRAGDLLQEMFYVYRENVFDKLIINIERRDGKIYLYDGYCGPARTMCDLLEPFPNSLVRSEEEKKAILVHLACNDAVSWMSDLVEHVLGEIVSNFTEYSTIYKDPKLTLVAADAAGTQDTNRYQHEVTIMKMKGSGEEYVLDLAGAQYGYYDPITPRSEYFSTRVECVLDRNPIGHWKGWNIAQFAGIGSGNFTADVRVAVAALNYSTSKYLKGFTERWEISNNKKVKTVLEGDLSGFLEFKASMVDVLNRGLQGCLDKRSRHEVEVLEALPGQSASS